MYKKFLTILSRKSVRLVALGTASLATSFSLGMKSAGDVQPFTLIEAGSVSIQGDMDNSGSIDLADVRIILEIAQGYRQASPAQILADPNDDGRLTVDDALRILSTL